MRLMSQTSIMLQLYACGQKFIEIFTLNVTENLKNAVPERVKENQITSIYSLRSDMLLLSKWPNITGLIYSSLSMIIQVKVALNRAVVDSDWRFGNLCCSHVQSKSELYHVSWWLLQDLNLTYSKSSFDFSTNLLHLILSLLRISVIYYFELI